MSHAGMSGAARWLVLASIAFGLAFPLSGDAGLPVVVALAWKGLPVLLLALAAASVARERDGWMLAAVLGFCALGDVLLELNQTAGALGFMAGHVVAIALYLRNRRPSSSGSQRALAVVVVPAAMFIAWALPTDRAAAPGIALYCLFVTVMAATAWLSRFPRYRTGIGAMMFLISDLLIFARMGPLADTASVGLAIWLLYYVGQLLIYLGVTATLAGPKVSESPSA